MQAPDYSKASPKKRPHKPDFSNLHPKAAAVVFLVDSTATVPTARHCEAADVSNTLPRVSLAEALATLAAYIGNPPATPSGRTGATVAVQKFAELVSAINALAG